MFKQLNFKKAGPILVYSSIAFMVMAFFMFEYVNYITTAESLQAMFGNGLWIMCIAFAMVVIDVAALVLIFIPEGAGKAGSHVTKVLASVWAAVSIIDITLSWYFITLRMESTVVASPRAVEAILWIMPILIAVMIWGVQLGMLFTLGQIIGGNRARSTMALRVSERG